MVSYRVAYAITLSNIQIQIQVHHTPDPTEPRQAGRQAGRQPKTLQGPAPQPARHPPDKRNEITMVAPMSGHSQVDLQDPEAGKISRVNCGHTQAHQS